MQSVFGMHDRSKFQIYCYATTPPDGTLHRQKIEGEADVFINCAAWSTQRIVEQIVNDKIHVLVNLNGYTKGARNEIFAARPAPVLVAFMGFAGTLGAGWCDYVVTDPIVCPPWTVRCEVRAERRHRAVKHAIADQRKDEAGALDWVYTERMIYMPHTYFVNDHRQGFRVDEELRGIQTADELWITEQDARYKMRHEIFPQISDDVFIFANFNQLYKIDPTLFRMWLRVLERVPNAIIWLLRFPAAGEEHLHRAAVEWAGEEVARRVVFTDVAPKHIHIKRGRVADAFLDTPECNAHTTAVDILWSGTPVLTWPRHEHKLCSRVAASVACATGHGRQMVVSSADEYVDKAVEWATTLSYEYQYVLPMAGQQTILSVDPQTGYMKRRVCHGPVMELRKQLFMRRDRSRLFDTLRWTRNLERGLTEAWRRWVTGEDDPTVYAPAGRCIWVIDEDDAMPSHSWVREMIGW
ncbi:glycosyl transferase family 41-domain-containing protein [Coemansia spiralis]|nr:glycosyl transferase family 41-domain-containing protein [Coemansia spiralis]